MRPTSWPLRFAARLEEPAALEEAVREREKGTQGSEWAEWEKPL